MAAARKTTLPATEADVAKNQPVVQADEIRAILKEAEARGLLGAKDRQMGGRFPTALVDAAQRASGISEATDLLTYALVRVAFEDNYGEKLLSLAGSVPRGTFIAD